MSFQNPQLSLATLLQEVREGKLQLPDFQREYQWDDDRIRSLLATLTLGHPMGVIMTLETGNEQVRFKPKVLAGVGAVDREPERLLLDGQQRMTSLYQALGSGKPVQTCDSRKKQLNRWYYLDIDTALADPTDRDDAIVSVPEDRKIRSDFGRTVDLDLSTPALEQQARMFPFSLIFDPQASMQWMMEFAWPAGLADQERATTVQRFQAEILGPTIGYDVPAIALGKDTSKEAVCTVFEKVNTGGLPLDVFELLTASFAGDASYYDRHGDDFRLNEDWRGISDRLGHHDVLADLEPSDFLQAVTLLATRTRRLEAESAGKPDPRPAISARRADVLKLDLGEYLTWAPKVVEALEWAAGFLAQEYVFTSRDLPYRTQLVPLAALHAILGTDIDIYSVNHRIRRWYWSGVLGELYGGGVETRFARDLEQVPEWATGHRLAEPDTVARAGFREARLLSLKTRNSSAYKGLSALMLAGGAMDWKYHQPIGHASFPELKVDIHHVFPVAWCDKAGVDANHRDSIVNKTPLSAATNRSIGGRSPQVYLLTLEKDTGLSADELDAVVATHHIDPAYLRMADFDAFFAGRMAAIVALVEEAMGQHVVRDISSVAEAQEVEEEAPDAFTEEPDDTGDVNAEISVTEALKDDGVVR